MKLILVIFALLVTGNAAAAEPKPILQIDVDALTNELQVMSGGSGSLDLAWWIPVEFWEATLRQSPDITDGQVEQLLSVLKSYSVLGVVQADISSFGAFHFYEKDTVMDGLKVQATGPDGVTRTISHTEPSDPDLRLLLDQMRPVLAQALGNMGENFYFFPMPAFDEDERRVPSPYEKWTLQVTMKRDESETVLQLEMPVDALFTPRKCPNGKPAHVSWSYCPWSGTKLPD